MPTVEVFDPPMCCPTGVCGPVVDPELPRFAALLDGLAAAGVPVARHNLAQEPRAFAENGAVLAAMRDDGDGALPLVVVDGRVVSRGRYPSAAELAGWLGIALPGPASPSPLPSLPALAPREPDGDSGCCR